MKFKKQRIYWGGWSRNSFNRNEKSDKISHFSWIAGWTIEEAYIRSLNSAGIVYDKS